MAPHLRDLTDADADADAVLDINEEVVELLAPMDRVEYRWFLGAATAWAADVDGALAGFVLLLEPGVDYPSRNYAWVSERFEDFLYLDRVAVAADHRRRGVATAIYDAVEGLAARSGRPVILEVNVDPPNHASLAFHLARGYEPLGDLAHPEGKTVRFFQRHP
ncbi:MAG: GNAT family N-acetyltransferase [Acidimicrobiales bacterium]